MEKYNKKDLVDTIRFIKMARASLYQLMFEVDTDELKEIKNDLEKGEKNLVNFLLEVLQEEFTE